MKAKATPKAKQDHLSFFLKVFAMFYFPIASDHISVAHTLIATWETNFSATILARMHV